MANYGKFISNDNDRWVTNEEILKAFYRGQNLANKASKKLRIMEIKWVTTCTFSHVLTIPREDKKPRKERGQGKGRTGPLRKSWTSTPL